MLLWIIFTILILTCMFITVIKMNSCYDRSDYVIKRKLVIGVGLVIGILSDGKLNETLIESFDTVKDLMIARIRDHKNKLSWKKQLEIEDAISIGLVSYTDIILLYSYALDDKEEDLFIFYRNNHKQIAEECLLNEYLPVASFIK